MINLQSKQELLKESSNRTYEMMIRVRVLFFVSIGICFFVTSFSLRSASRSQLLFLNINIETSKHQNILKHKRCKRKVSRISSVHNLEIEGKCEEEEKFRNFTEKKICQAFPKLLASSLVAWSIGLGHLPVQAYMPPPTASWVAELGWTTAVNNPPPPSEGNCIECIGVVNGLLADCPNTPTCVSSQDDRPYCFLEPWQYDMSQAKAMKKLVAKMEFYPNAKIIQQTDDYLRVEFYDKLSGSIDDAEWYFTPNDSIIQFRSARRQSKTDLAQNRKRMEDIRISLGFEKVPVLRNRKRALVFFESPLDSFGPATIRDLTPEEMDNKEMYRGDIDPYAPEWQAPSKQMRALKNLVNAQIDDRTRSK